MCYQGFCHNPYSGECYPKCTNTPTLKFLRLKIDGNSVKLYVDSAKPHNFRLFTA